MNKSGVIGEILETGGSMAKKSGKAIAKTAGDTGKVAAAQITGADNSVSDKDIVKNLYGIKDDKKNNSKPTSSQLQPQQQGQGQDVTPSVEDKKRLEELRRQLHNEVYYDPLVNPQKPQEERPAEKVEREEREEMRGIQEGEKKKPSPLVVQRIQQRVEKFPGRSG